MHGSDKLNKMLQLAAWINAANTFQFLHLHQGCSHLAGSAAHLHLSFPTLCSSGLGPDWLEAHILIATRL
jgi:hypothetical protein